MIELIQRYHSYFKLKYSVSTFESCKYTHYEFLNFLKGRGMEYFYDVTEYTFEDWLIHLAEVRKNSIRSRYKKIRIMRDFFKWLVGEDYLLTSPLRDDFYLPKMIYKLRVVPTQKGALALVKQAGDSVNHPIRNRAMLELCYSTGLRRMELQSLNLFDVRESEIRVIGKGNKERIVPMGSKAIKWLNKYIYGERLHIIRGHNNFEEALFIGRTGGRLCLGAYNVIMKKQIKSDVGLHSFRHACATHMLENGSNIVVLQKLLGHEKLSTTQKYTRVNTGHLREMLDKCHPRR